MLIIDSPPRIVQELARYPSLPILFHKLSDNAVILMDDMIRPQEKEIQKMWLNKFKGFAIEEIDTEKGAVILFRR